MKPFFISYSAATGAALIGASRPRGIEYGREIRCYEDQLQIRNGIMSTKAKEKALRRCLRRQLARAWRPAAKSRVRAQSSSPPLFPPLDGAQSADGRKRDFGPFHLKKRVPAHPSGAPGLSSAKPCLLRCSR